MTSKHTADIKSKTVSNFIWRFAERCGAQGVAFVVSIVLARLLSPEDYGIISLVTVITAILQVFVDSGMGNALIQKKDADNVDFSTVFYFNIFLCIVLYIILFFCAPAIALFYAQPELTPVIRVLSLTILISGVKNVQQAYVSKKMIFKKFFYATLGGTLVAAFVGIWMAYQGYGVWALVIQQILNAIIDTLILWITVKWRPNLVFSLTRLKGLFSYGWKLLVSSLINTIYNDVRQLIIGKMYSSADLAYYNRGKQFPHLFVSNINASIDSVLFPVMSEKQDEKEKIKQMTRRSIMVSSYIMWPLLLGLMAIGRPLIELLLTEKWLPCLPYLYIFCFVYGMQPIHTANQNAIKAIGRSDLFLKMEIIKKVVGISIILITMHFGVLVIGLGSVVYTIFASIVNVFPNRTLLGYKYTAQLQDILPSFLLAAFMAVMVYFVSYVTLPDVAIIAIQILLGAGLYIGGSILFKMEIFRYLLDVVKKFKNKGN